MATQTVTAEPKAAEPKAAEPKAAESKAAEPKATGSRRRKQGVGARARARALAKQEAGPVQYVRDRPFAAQEASSTPQAAVAQDGNHSVQETQQTDDGEEKATPLPLRRGDIVVTVPSDKFRQAVELEVQCLIRVGADWKVHFCRSTYTAWLRNFGKTYHLKQPK